MYEKNFLDKINLVLKQNNCIQKINCEIKVLTKQILISQLANSLIFIK